MAALVRATDWSGTPLGPMQGWPQSLRTAVSICLGSRFPMMVWWGSSLTFIYNDAYAPMLGRRHPEALGRPGREVWADVWPVIAPQVEAVLQRGGSTWNERVHLLTERNGFPEDAWFTWSYSPIPDEHGGIGGLFNACREDTEQVLAERERDRLLAQLAAERERLTIAFQQSPAFMAILRGPGHVFEFVNDQYDRLVGHRPMLGKPVREALPEVKGQGYFELLDRVYASGEPFVGRDMAVELARDPGQAAEIRYVEFVYQPIREVDGSVSGILVHGIDTTNRKRAEERLARDATLLANVRDSVIVTDLAGSVTFWNEGATRLFGWTADEMLGRPLTQRLPEPARAEAAGWIARIAAGEAEYDGEWLDARKDGSPVWIEATTRLIRGADGKSMGIMGVARDISERKRADEARRELAGRYAEQSRLFDRVLSSITDFAYIFDLDGRFTFVNKPLLDLWGLTLDQATGKNFFDLAYPPELAEKLHRQIQQVINTRQHLSDETPYTSPTGAGGYYQYIFSPVIGSDGSVEAVAGSTRDITDHRRAEEALRASEGRLRLLSELGELTRDVNDPEQVMAAVAARLGGHLRASRCAYAEVEPDGERFTIRHDYTDGCRSTVGSYALSRFGPRAAADQRAGRTLVVADVDRELSPPDGADAFNAIGVKAVVCCPLVKGGRLAAMMAVHQSQPRAWTAEEVGLLEAVAERSWAYIERARAARALARSESEFRLLADAMPQIVWAARPDGVLDYYNRRWFEYLDLPENDCEAARWDRHLHPEDLPPTLEAWRAALGSGQPYTVQFRARAADGTYRWFLARAMPIRSDGEVVRWFGTCTDIHDQKQLQERYQHLLESERAARADAERASRTKDEFLATLSHELRTPLNAILGWSQILRSGAASDADLAEGLVTIERNARAQTQIIEDLLDMSRIISGKIRLDVQRIDLAAVVHAGIETVRHAAEAKGVEVQWTLDPRASAVYGDPNRLQQVVWNLVSNAVKFTPRGGRVHVVLERVNSHVEVSVIDTGQGIKPEFLPHVFDRFRQADASTTREHGGLGLGLSIVKQLVELHGGTIRARSDGPGTGTTFTVTLPLRVVRPEPAAGQDPSPSNRQAGADPAADFSVDACMQLNGARVLVVDDETDARAVVKRLLEGCGAAVLTASTAAEAVSLVEAERPDVLVSDIGMPGEDGYSLIRRVRLLGAHRGGNVPALALTAYARAEDRVRAVRAGFQTHVVKPVEPAELITMVASLAGRTGHP